MIDLATALWSFIHVTRGLDHSQSIDGAALHNIVTTGMGRSHAMK